MSYQRMKCVKSVVTHLVIKLLRVKVEQYLEMQKFFFRKQRWYVLSSILTNTQECKLIIGLKVNDNRSYLFLKLKLGAQKYIVSPGLEEMPYLSPLWWWHNNCLQGDMMSCCKVPSGCTHFCRTFVSLCCKKKQTIPHVA